MSFPDPFFPLFARLLIPLIESFVLLDVVEFTDTLDMLLAVSSLQLPFVSVNGDSFLLLLDVVVLSQVDAVRPSLHFLGNECVPRLDGFKPFLIIILVKVDF